MDDREEVIPPFLPIDKSTWGDGPWQHEPDRLDFEHASLPCLALRSPHMGNWCGYAAVPPGHPLHGSRYDMVDVAVHRGLTYGSPCAGHICHVPKPGEPADVWWFGFDCAHAGDFSPAMEARLLAIAPALRPPAPYNHAAAVAANSFMVEQYRTLEYVRAEIMRLAEQLAGLV